MKGRLNSFQKSMVQWNQLHPYNAIHVAEVPGLLDPARLRTRINTVVQRRGMARVALDGGRFAYLPDDGKGGIADCEMITLAGGADPRRALVAEMERQLNLPFPTGRPFSPFRFLLVPAGESFYLGLVFYHVVADAESVVGLLWEIVSAYLDEFAAADAKVPELYPDGRSRLLGPHVGVLFRKLVTLPAQFRQLGQSHRPSVCGSDPQDNGFALFTLEPPEWRVVLAAARAWKVTVNDLFMAALLKALSPCAEDRAQAPKRRKLSLGCIVNARRDLGFEGRPNFGVFLGSFTVTHAVPDGVGLRELAGDIQEQTAAIKRRKLYLAMPLELALARFVGRFFSADRRRKLYAKYYPLWGGITNMNLNSLWPAGGNAPLDHWRGVSTGPITPLVLSVTTAGERVNMGVSYRTSVFSREDIGQLQARFLRQLEAAR